MNNSFKKYQSHETIQYPKLALRWEREFPGRAIWNRIRQIASPAFGFVLYFRALKYSFIFISSCWKWSTSQSLRIFTKRGVVNW